jgi:arylformamidase
MRTEEVWACLSQARMVDLTKKVMPGGGEGPVGTGQRKYEIERFTFPPGELMHHIEMDSHISTHVEAPMHYVTARYGRKADDVSEMPLSRLFGPAVLVNCQSLTPKSPVSPEFLEGFSIQEGDIVLIGNAPPTAPERCHLIKESAEYLLQKRIKMIGVDDTVFPEDQKFIFKDFSSYFIHDLMLSNDIPMIEGLANLGDLKKPRFLFFAFPAMMGGLESFPIRAVAFEER